MNETLVRRCRRFAIATLGVLMAWFANVGNAEARNVIRQNDSHRRVELEPHGLLGLFVPPGDGGDLGFGAGLRVAIPVAPQGFIENVNDSVAIGFGLDWAFYSAAGTRAGTCAEYRGVGSERICVRVNGAGGASHYFYAPVVMQWNFYLSEQWSVFGEPGLGLFLEVPEWEGSPGVGPLPVFQAGGRYHFTDEFTLTMRIGYPYLSVGVSLLF